MAGQLEVINVEKLKNVTDVYQAEDGTMFEYKSGKIQEEVCVRKGDDEYTVDLNSGISVDTLAVCGNALFLKSPTTKKIYKIAWNELGCTSKRIRYMNDDESIGKNGLCVRIGEDGDNRRIYHLGDCPDNGGVKLDESVPWEYLKERIHRQATHFLGKVFFLKKAERLAGSVGVLDANALGLQLPLTGNKWNSWAAEASPYIYIANGSNLYTVNVETLDVLPVLALRVDDKRVSDMAIVSVIDGLVTATALIGIGTNLQKVLITALFPEGFLDFQTKTPTTGVEGAKTAVPDAERLQTDQKRNVDGPPASKKSLIDERIDQLAREIEATKAANPTERSQNEQFLDKKLQEIEKEFKVPENETEEEKKRREYENEMSATLNELLIKNMELTQELQDLQNAPTASEKAMDDLIERQSDLVKKQTQLERVNWELTQELDRTETLNDELEAANAQLVRDKEELASTRQAVMTEKQAIIDELEAEIARLTEDKRRLNEKVDWDGACLDDDLKRKIELIAKQNELLSKALAETSTDPTSEGEYEMIDEATEN